MNKWTSGIAVVGFVAAIVACGGSGTGTGQTCVGGFCESAATGGCEALTACCPKLPVTENPSECYTVASGGTTTACTQSLSTYWAAGYCASDTGTLPLGPECEALSTCCSAGGLTVGSCAAIASEGDENACLQAQTEYKCAFQVAGSGSGSGFATLCSTLICLSGASCVITNGQASCVGGSSSGSSTDAGCSALAQCCTSIASADAQGCKEVLSQGTDQECAQALAEYHAAGSC